MPEPSQPSRANAHGTEHSAAKVRFQTMTAEERALYRHKAIQMWQQARRAQTPYLRAMYESIAEGWAGMAAGPDGDSYEFETLRIESGPH